MYLTVMDQCLDDKHSACPGRENTPAPGSGRLGGGACICPCHPTGGQPVNYRLVADVAQRAIEARERRDADTPVQPTDDAVT